MKLNFLIQYLQAIGNHYLQHGTQGMPIENHAAALTLQNLSPDISVSEPMQVIQLLTDLEHIFEDVKIDPNMQAVVLFNLYTMFKLGSEANKAFSSQYFQTLEDKTKVTLNTSLAEFIGALKNKVKNAYSDYVDEYEANTKHKNITAFDIGDNLQAQRNNSFSHTVKKIVKTKNQTVWYAKFHADKVIAAHEVVAQEFYRLIAPMNPKTRLSKDSEENDVYVISKEVPDAVSLQVLRRMNPNGLQHLINSHETHGLAALLTINLVTQETDSKFDNIMYDRNNNCFFKIDGDWCFSKIRDPEQFKNLDITEHDIAHLPFVKDFCPFNWLDIYASNQISASLFVDPNLPNAPHFRQEINETMLKMLLLPPALVKAFIASYISDQNEINNLSDYFLDRLVDLKTAALANPNFRNYMQTPDAEIYLEKALTELKDFIPMKKQTLINADNTEKITTALQENFQELVKSCAPQKVVAEAPITARTIITLPSLKNPKIITPAAPPPTTRLLHKRNPLPSLAKQGIFKIELKEHKEHKEEKVANDKKFFLPPLNIHKIKR